MKIKLHNKFEITIRNKTYTAYNTLLKSVYEKIFNLEQYTSHIAIGTGLSALAFNDTKLNNYLCTFSAETEEIQNDVSKGTLFIKKVSKISENDDQIFSFSELGLTSSNDFDPTIYNHVLLTDSDGTPVSITRNQGDAMEIRVTIYLELTPESQALFTPGNNILIKQILGENLNIKDNNLYFLRGENLTENKTIYRTTPNLDNKVVAEKTIIFNNDNSVDIAFFAELGQGGLEEALVCFDDEVCMRFNTLEINPPITQTITSNPTQNVLEIDSHIKNITSVSKIANEGEETIETYNKIAFSKKLTDKIENLFDQPFTAQTQKFIAKDGKHVAFIHNSYVHLYKHTDYAFTKVNTINIPTGNLFKMFMFENIVLVLYSTEPYIRLFEIENNVALAKTISLDIYNNSSFSYSWLDAEAVLFKSGKIKIGFIINNADYMPIVLTLTKSITSPDTYNDSIERPQLPTAKKVFAIQPNSFSDGLIGFLTDTYEGASYYFQEEFFENTSALRDSSEAQYQLLANTLGLQTGGRTIISQKETSPFLYIYYYPNFTKAPSDISNGVKHYLSYDGNYIIAKYQDETYKIFNLHIATQMTEFENNFPSYVNQSEIKDFAFVGDVLLAFTNTNTFGICLKKSHTRIDNIDDSSTYKVTYEKYDLLGLKKLEGVKLDLLLGFNKNLM